MPSPSNNPGRVLSFVDHLDELRTRIIICLTFFFLAFFGSLFFSPQIVAFLIAPLTSIRKDAAQSQIPAPAPADARELILQVDEAGLIRVAAPRIVEQSGKDGTTSKTPKPTSPSGVATSATAAQEPTPIPGNIDPCRAGAPLTTASLQNMPLDRAIIRLPYGASPIRIGHAAPPASNPTALHFLSPMEPFMLLMKGAFLAAITVSLPIIVYQLWLFVAPGLLMRERAMMRWLLFSAMMLFPLGALFAYAISSVCLRFLIGFADLVPGLVPSIVASKYVGFILMLMVLFGAAFEFPIVLVLLSRLGFVTSETLVKKRRTAIVAITAVAAFGIPSPDPFSMIAFMIPCFALYEGAILAIRAIERGERRRTGKTPAEAA